MAEDADYTEGSLGTEIAPPTRPRDQGGKYIRETAKPENFLSPRAVEGDSSDARDIGDVDHGDARERNYADGREDDTRVQRTRKPETDVEFDDAEPEQLARHEPDEDEGADKNVEPAEDDDGTKYEVTVDGEPKEVTLNEALAGYIRQETFHKRMTDLATIQTNMEADASNLANGWKAWHKARADYEQDLFALIPQEPNWDDEFAKNPQAAHANQKIYQTLYKKLADSRNSRIEREAKDAEEAEKRLAKYAQDGQNAFYTKHAKLFPDRAAYDKNIQSMRRTAMTAGFSEAEVATVFDPRMLEVLLKASKYDRMQAAQPRAVNPGQGRTVPPGSTTPRSGNVNRKGRDEASRQLASSGRLDDAAAYFRTIL